MVRVHHHHRRIPQPKVVELIQDLTGGVIGPRDGCVIMPAELLQLDVGACSVRVVHKVFAGGDNTCLEVERTDFTWMGYTMRTDR